MGVSDLANFVGTHLVPFTNPRVVCPPGRVRMRGRPNIMVATPMRSGTHILIDLILNNLPDYRARPLYVDLDQCAKQGGPDLDLLGALGPQSGYVLKTHMPLNVPDGMVDDPRVMALTDAACVITVHRDRDDVCRSLGRWHGVDQAAAEATYGPEYDRFWQQWEGRDRIAVAFPDLFDPAAMQRLLTDIATRTGTTVAPRYVAPPSGGSKAQIYATKLATRLLGRHAPRVDTTIHTLKS